MVSVNTENERIFKRNGAFKLRILRLMNSPGGKRNEEKTYSGEFSFAKKDEKVRARFYIEGHLYFLSAL